MRLGVKPAVFLARLLAFFFLTYLLWKPIAPFYTQFLATLTRGFVHLTECVSEPRWQPVTEMRVRETADGRPAIFYQHRQFPEVQSGIPAEWIQANLVLLIPLMLATPARTYGQRFRRLALALLLAVGLQVLDVTVTVKHLYASTIPGYSSGVAAWLYGFADAFTQAMDTQLFPFAIWAGIHFNQLLGRGAYAPSAATAATSQPATHRPRHKRKAAKKGAGTAKTAG